MKKILKNALLAVGIVLCLKPVGAFADDIRIYLENERLNLSNEAFIEDGRILVPLRSLCENMGVDVCWREDTREVLLKRDFNDCICTIGKNEILVNNKTKTIDVAPRIVNNRTYVPLRAVQEAFGDKIKWNNDFKTVYITRTDKAYVNGDWNDIVDLVKKYDEKVNSNEVIASVKVCVPQILNPNNMTAIDKINEYYKEAGSEQFNKFKDEILEARQEGLIQENWNRNGIAYGYELSYDIGHNANDILSVQNMMYMNTGGAHPNWAIGCEVFDTKTGEKLEIEDILKGSKEEIQQFIIDGFTKLIDENPDNYFETAKEDLKDYIDSVEFYIDEGNLVFLFNHYIIAPYASGIQKFVVNIEQNKDMFTRDFVDICNYNQQLCAKTLASNHFNCDDVELIDKTTLENDKCYVFKKGGTDELVAVDKNGNNLYVVKKQDNIYAILSTKQLKNEVSNKEALKLVMDKINSNEYSYEIGGYLLEDGNEYIIVVIQDIEEKTTSKLVVNRRTKEISTYYFE